MVRLHVLHDQVIGQAAFERTVKVHEPLGGEVHLRRVKDGDLLVRHDVGIISHAVRDFVLAFEKINGVVVHADIADVVLRHRDHPPLS